MSQRARAFFLDLCREMLNADETGSADTQSPGQSMSNNNSDTNGHPTSSAASSETTPSDFSEWDEVTITSDADSSVDFAKAHVLIATHGLLLRELRQVIVQRFTGDLGEKAAEVKKISPNTGRSQLTLEVCQRGKKMSVKCVSIDSLNDYSHLTADGKDLTSFFRAAI